MTKMPMNVSKHINVSTLMHKEVPSCLLFNVDCKEQHYTPSQMPCSVHRHHRLTSSMKHRCKLQVCWA